MGNFARTSFLLGFLVAFWMLPRHGAAVEATEPGWRIANIGFGIKPSFDFDANDRIHVMGMTEQIIGVVWHASADDIGGPWSPVDVASGYFYGPGDIRVDATGAAHLAWHDHDDQDPNHLVVAPGGATTLRRIISPGHDGWDNTLAFDSQGTLHQTSVDPSAFGAPVSLEYGTFDGAAWTYDRVPGSGSFMYGFNTSLAIDGLDEPHVVYTRASDWVAPGDLNYARRSASTWQVATIPTGSTLSRFASIALDDADRPHVAWFDVDAEDSTRGTVRYGVLDDGSWTLETVDTLENVSLGFSGAREMVSLALDGGNRPHLAYGDRRFVRYATRSTGSWSTTDILASTSDLYNGLVVLRLDSTDVPGIAFWQDHAGQPGLVRMAVLPEPSTLSVSAMLCLWSLHRRRS
ncbi:MAG: hypothetical protein CMJ18_15305 [Phycisphaeraceae bacterium]|nr:hypothetical protein [Phycisphaeraceae bacterium]